MKKGKLNVIMGLQWGSEAKGKLVHWMTENEGVDVATCDFGPNAGHSIEYDGVDGKYVFKQLPVSACNKDTHLLINAGSIIEVPRLLKEINVWNASKRLLIHPHAAVVTDACRLEETKVLRRIASTMQGTGAAIAMKVMRRPDATLAKDVPELSEWIGDTTEALHRYLKAGAVCLAEGAQGFDLSLNHGRQYPYVTGRDVTTCSILSNAGVPPRMVGDVYGCIRTYPIRVGHVIEHGKKRGDSGPCWEDQIETDWESLQLTSGSMDSLEELTTVTKRVRRVFTFSNKQLARAVKICGPTHLFINFMNHLNVKDLGKRALSELSMESRDFLTDVGRSLGDDVIVSHLGTGPKLSDMVVLV